MYLRGEPVVEMDVARDYRRLLAMLGARARRLGSRDPESAAQEALKRSLENPASQHAVEFYLSDVTGDSEPEWRVDQLFAWLHGVVTNVVREERQRAGHRREVPLSRPELHEPADPAKGQLDRLIQREIEEIVSDCFPKLDHEYRTVLKMRVDGMKYGDIATRLGVNENTVATWVSRGVRALGQKVRTRIERRAP